MLKPDNMSDRDANAGLRYKGLCLVCLNIHAKLLPTFCMWYRNDTLTGPEMTCKTIAIVFSPNHIWWSILVVNVFCRRNGYIMALFFFLFSQRHHHHIITSRILTLHEHSLWDLLSLLMKSSWQKTLFTAIAAGESCTHSHLDTWELASMTTAWVYWHINSNSRAIWGFVQESDRS